MAMALKNSRINVTFDPIVVQTLYSLALHEHKSMASLVRDLALEALDRREDLQLSKISEQLDLNGTKTYSHDTAWS
jgi:hypothetical protein